MKEIILEHRNSKTLATNQFMLFILVSILSLLISPLKAQTAADSDPEAKKILKDLKNKYDSFSSMEVQFDLTLDLPGQSKEKQKGKVIQSGLQYILELDQQAIYCNGEIVWVHLKDNNEVQINDVEESQEDDFLTPQDMMKIYESEDFYYAITNKQKVKGKNLVQIEFKPLNENSEYKKMRIEVNTSTIQLEKMDIFNKDGSRYTLDITTLSSNKSYASEVFNFNAKKFPGIHVEDLRL